MSAVPRVGILTGFGINADVELVQAFELAGAHAELLPVTTLVDEPQRLTQLQILGFPGGFSFGDHLGSGRVLAQLVKKRLQDELTAFAARGGLVLGVCNGFQTLVKMGILPNLNGDWTPQTTLIGNDTGTSLRIADSFASSSTLNARLKTATPPIQPVKPTLRLLWMTRPMVKGLPLVTSSPQ